MKVDVLREYDSKVVERPSGDGGVLLSPGLQGRIFCRIGGGLIHRLDVERLKNPSAEEFNNIGGNSLWPAPEGGAFAYNYVDGSDAWVVQPGIAEAPYIVCRRETTTVEMEKEITLQNRLGTICRLHCRRKVTPGAGGEWPAGDGSIKTVGYRCHDIFTPSGRFGTDQLMLAAWSLEQFPGGDRVVAFAKTPRPAEAINFDFYGKPAKDPVYAKDHVLLPLGGDALFQVGVTTESEPTLIGALDFERGLLILRKTPKQDGVYFNIADNTQPEGPFSAADMYSVFSGGDLNFYELETVGPMKLNGGLVGACELHSETWIAQGPVDVLAGLLAEQWDIHVNKGGVK